MKSDNGFAIALFAMVIGGAVALAIANDIAAPICRAAAEATPKDKFDFGCLEFWLNRYQTAIIGFLAAFIAIAAIRPSLRQMAEAARQSDGLARAVIAEKIVEFQQEKTAVDTLRQQVAAAVSLTEFNAPKTRRDPTSLQYSQDLDSAGSAIAAATGAIERFLTSEPDVDSRTSRRASIVETAQKVQAACYTLSILYPRHVRYGKIKEESFLRQEGAVLNGASDLYPLLYEQSADLTEAIEQSWRDIRMLEARIQQKGGGR